MVTCVVGGQFGSEGKGAIVGEIGWLYNVHVRVGAANAGHTVYTKMADGSYEKHVVQQIPCAAYANPKAKLYLGAGALISPEILEREIEECVAWRRAHKVDRPFHIYIDPRAHVVLDEHKEREAKTDLIGRIGSTSATAKEGIGIAQAARALRSGYKTAAEHFVGSYRDLTVIDTVCQLHYDQTAGKNILLEGTQGTSLSCTTGAYPYVTSRCVSAPGLLADCGLAHADRVIMVCRSFPIRVAGNSGPFWEDSREIAWEDIGIDPELERTTVTKKMRRVATFSHKQIEHNAQVNGATEIALTFADYLNAEMVELYHRRTWAEADEISKWPVVGALIGEIERRTGLPVKMIGVGPHSIIRRTSSIESPSQTD